jgi:cysteine desulfurase
MYYKPSWLLSPVLSFNNKITKKGIREMLETNLIYLDYQASTPLNKLALKAMTPYLTSEFANPHSMQHIGGIQSYKAIEDAQSQVADLINADANEIIFTSGATEANNLALFGFCNQDSKRKRILISSIEHKSIIEPAEHLMTLGFKVEYIPVDSQGIVKLDKYKEMLSDDVLLVSIIMVNNEIGTIQTIKELAYHAKTHGAIFHTDAAQAPVTKSINVCELNVDLLSLSSHKMYGPKGIGALYISNYFQNKIKPMILGGGQQNGIRAGTIPTHLCVGFGEAALYIQKNNSCIFNEIEVNRNYFWKGLNNTVSKIKLVGPNFDKRHVGNLNISFEGISADTLLGMLQKDIAASTGSACSSGIIENSHVLSAIGLSYNEQGSCIRISFGPEISNTELDQAIILLKKAIDILDRM